MRVFSRIEVAKVTHPATMVKAYCDLLHAQGDTLSGILQSMQAGIVSIEDGLQSVADVLIRCSSTRSGGRNTDARLAHSNRRRGEDAAWFDDTCRSARDNFKSAWSAHLACPDDAALRQAAVAARKQYKRAVYRHK